MRCYCTEPLQISATSVTNINITIQDKPILQSPAGRVLPYIALTEDFVYRFVLQITRPMILSRQDISYDHIYTVRFTWPDATRPSWSGRLKSISSRNDSIERIEFYLR